MEEVVFGTEDVVLSLVDELVEAEADEIVWEHTSNLEGYVVLEASRNNRVYDGIVKH